MLVSVPPKRIAAITAEPATSRALRARRWFGDELEDIVPPCVVMTARWPRSSLLASGQRPVARCAVPTYHPPLPVRSLPWDSLVTCPVCSCNSPAPGAGPARPQRCPTHRRALGG